MLKRIFVILLIPFSLYSGEGIKINEIMPRNGLTVYDEDLDAEDWIELYNSSSKTISLEHYRISDESNYDGAWELPDAELEPCGRLLIFASGKDRPGSGKYIIEAAGHGLNSWAIEDGFRFLYLKTEGDFEIEMKIHSLRNTGPWGRAGLMVRKSIDKHSPYSMLFFGGYSWGHPEIMTRKQVEGEYYIDFDYMEIDDHKAHLKMKRRGDSIFGYALRDGYYWQKVGAEEISSEWDNLGIAFTSADRDQIGKLAVTDLILNGDTVAFETLQAVDIATELKGDNYYSAELHTDFKLKSGGETVFLWDDKGELIDMVDYPDIPHDISYGRYPCGSENFGFFDSPSPGSRNDSAKSGITQSPGFSHRSGIYDEIPFLEINSAGTSEIYYTTDGSLPDKESKRYLQPLKIDESTVVKAIAFEDSKLPSEVVTRSYFIDEEFKLPVISISGNEEDFFGKYGIFHERNVMSSAEIPAFIEFLDTAGRPRFSTNAGMKLHGGATRHYPQKSSRIFNRDKYGSKDFEHDFFGEESLPVFDKLIFRNAGQDWWFAYIRDALLSVTARTLGTIEAPAYNPALAFINGSFYGIYNIRERIDDNHLAEKYGIDNDSINFMEAPDFLKNGKSIGYHRVYDSLALRNMNTAAGYDFINRHFDLENFIDYSALEIYSCNTDWPHFNVRYWSSPELDGRWRFILHDCDLIMNYNSAPPERWALNDLYLSDSQFAVIFKNLMKNRRIREKYINRAADLLNSALLPGKLIPVLDSLAANIGPAIPRQHQKYDSALVDWEGEIEKIREFIRERPKWNRLHIMRTYEIPESLKVEMDVSPPGAGKIRINSLRPEKFPWEGYYFRGIPVQLEAVPAEGFIFAGWDIPELQDSPEKVSVDFDTSKTITALFKLRHGTKKGIVINEIMYKPSDEQDCRDWFELYNSDEYDNDISGWHFSDEDDSHTFTFHEGTVIPGGEYLIVSEEPEIFRIYYSDTVQVTGDFDFGLGRSDMIRLYNDKDELIDFVNYENLFPWPEGADGTGKSIELISWYLDNALPESWHLANAESGSPGERNTVFVSIKNDKKISEDAGNIYPNPCSGIFNLSLNQEIDIDRVAIIYDSKGRMVSRKVIPAMSGNIRFNVSDLPSGAYFLVLKDDLPMGARRSFPLFIVK